MKPTTMRIMIATALLVLATGVASAQSLQAEIPFAFRVGSKVMAPGTYRVTLNSQRHIVALSNYASKESAMLLPNGSADPPKEWQAKGDPMLSFVCAASRCELSSIWTGTYGPALTFPHRGIGREEHASLTEIRLVRAAD